MGNNSTKYNAYGGGEADIESLERSVTTLFISNTPDNRLLFESAVKIASDKTSCSEAVANVCKTIYFELADEDGNMLTSELTDNEQVISYMMQYMSSTCGGHVVQNAIMSVGSEEFQSALSSFY